MIASELSSLNFNSSVSGEQLFVLSWNSYIHKSFCYSYINLIILYLHSYTFISWLSSIYLDYSALYLHSQAITYTFITILYLHSYARSHVYLHHTVRSAARVSRERRSILHHTASESRSLPDSTSQRDTPLPLLCQWASAEWLHQNRTNLHCKQRGKWSL